MKKLIILLIMTATAFTAGCEMIALLASPTRSEIKIPAEFDISEHPNKKILILVEQPAWLNTGVNVRESLTKAVGDYLVKKAEVVREDIIGYEKLSEYRSANDDFAMLTAAQVGKALGADMVLLVMINQCQISEIDNMGYYKGLLATESIIFDVESSEKLWPKSEKSKSIKIGFDLNRESKDLAERRLASASAHCIVRYFYNCLQNRFKIAEDISGEGWSGWD